MGIRICMQAMESKHKTMVLEPVIDLVLSLQSFSNLWDKIMYCIYLSNNIYFHIGFYMYMYMHTSIIID